MFVAQASARPTSSCPQKMPQHRIFSHSLLQHCLTQGPLRCRCTLPNRVRHFVQQSLQHTNKHLNTNFLPSVDWYFHSTVAQIRLCRSSSRQPCIPWSNTPENDGRECRLLAVPHPTTFPKTSVVTATEHNLPYEEALLDRWLSITKSLINSFCLLRAVTLRLFCRMVCSLVTTQCLLISTQRMSSSVHFVTSPRFTLSQDDQQTFPNLAKVHCDVTIIVGVGGRPATSGIYASHYTSIIVSL